MIYFDQAASSYPKPTEVVTQMTYALNQIGGNPGRGGHTLANKAAQIISETREKAADLFGCSDPKKCTFYQNATIALNQAIKGISWSKGDHVITTSFEHNSVRRPLEFIRKMYGIEITYVEWNNNEHLFLEAVNDAVTSSTKLIAMTHASNVTGSILTIEELLQFAKEHNILTLVDASQTAGHLQIDMKKQGINMLAFPGHKGLLGPQGTGMLLLEGEFDLMPIHHGGTGENSESIEQPLQYPERLESGTLNTPGIAGLFGAFKEYENRLSEIVPRETILIEQLLLGLSNIPNIIIYGPPVDQFRMPIVAFNIQGVDSQEIAMILDTHYNISVRGGLHCSPITHGALNTMDQGVVRASVNMYNTESEVNKFLHAIQDIAKAYA